MRKYTRFCFLILCLLASTAFSGTGIGESESIFLTSLPPAPPTLISPLNGSETEVDTVSLYWSNQPHVSSYYLQVSSASDFSQMVEEAPELVDTCLVLDNMQDNSTLYWRAKAQNVAGSSEFSSVWSFTKIPTGIQDNQNIPEKFELLPAYPNPFNPVTTITYQVPQATNVSLVVYNSIGQAIRTLVNEKKQPGSYTVHWDSRNNFGQPVSSGMYLCRLTAANNVFTRKMIFLK